MQGVKLTKTQKDLIEKLGVCSEKSGSSPAEARIMGLLFVADVPELTFEEIYETLQISKSAVSNAVNRLLDSGHIDYVTMPGDRKRYFRANITGWEENYHKRFQRIFEVNSILKEVLVQRPKASKEFNTNLKNLIGFMGFIQAEMPALFKKWKEKAG